MSKRFTSFLVVAAAALLLAMPVQAQQVVKKAKASQKVMKVGPVKSVDLKKAKAARMKAESKVEGLAFRGFAAKNSNYLQASLEKVQENKALLEKQMKENFRLLKYGNAASMLNSGKAVVKGHVDVRNINFNASKPSTRRASNRAEAVDDHGIITSPAEGESKFYTRAGKEYFVSNQQLYVGDQEGMTEIVECEDGTIYIKDFISTVNAGTWVRGTKSGNTITIPAKQVVWYGTQYGIYIAKCTYVDDNTGWLEVAGDITLTIDGNTITLNDTDEDNPVAGFWTDDFVFSGYGNYETVFTYDSEYVPPTLVELPEGATVETWYQEQTIISDDGDNDGFTKVAFVGNDVYLSGLFENFPDSWIKGTISGTTVTFSGLQFLGNYGSYAIFATGSNGYTSQNVLQDFQMTYDANAKTLTSVNSLLANAAEDRVYFLEAYEDIVITKDVPEESVATTGANVDELPYSNPLATADEFADFGVIDSNKDGKTWAFDSDGYGTYYIYSSANEANDWLISPAIKLETGKKYSFSIDAACALASYPEKFEVLIGKEAKASALTQTVLEEVTVASVDYVTYENGNISVNETGYYHFGIHATSEANQFRLMVKNFLVQAGADAGSPDAVTDFTVAQVPDKIEVNVSFKAPTKTVAGDDLTELTKIDILRDGNVIKSYDGTTNDNTPTPGAAYNYVDNAADLTVGTHVYQIIPYNTVGMGVKSEEKTVFISATLDVPYTFDFSQNLLDLFTVIDNNNDEKTWKWNESNGAYYGYSTDNAADDYLISLPFNLKAGKKYNVIVAARNTGYEEKFEVKAGKAPTVAGLTETVIPETVVASQDEFTEYEGIFTPAEDGQYYFAIHATSKADQFNLLVSKLAIEFAPEATAPAAITAFTATAGAEGALEVNLAFTAPTKAVDGSDLSGTVDVKIYRDNLLVNTVEDVAVGTAGSWKDINVENGKTYTYYVVAANESGDGLKSEKQSVFVGQDELGDVENIVVTGTTPTTISLSWDAVKGVNGGYVNAANVKYAVVSTRIETVWFWQILVVDEVLGTVTGQTSGTFDYPVDEGEQEYKYFGVVALDADAELPAADDEYEGGYNWALVGTPYTLPFAESFTGGNLAYSVWAVDGSEYTLGIYTGMASDDDCALGMTTVEETGLVRLESGRVNIKGVANPTLLFDVMGLGVTTAKVYAKKDDGNWEAIQNVTVTDEYATVKVPLKNHNGERFIRFAIGTDIVNPAIVVDMDDYGDPVYEYHDMLIVDNIRIVDLYQYDLSVNLTASPKSVVAGKTIDFTATITNEGENAAEGCTIKAYANNEVLYEASQNVVLQPFTSITIPYTHATTVFDKAGDVTVRVEVIYENDLNPANNSTEVIITIKEPTAAGPENVGAEDKGNDGVILTWTAPNIGETQAQEVTEDFENQEVFEPFGLGGITATEHTGAFGDWTLYDGNGIAVYGFQNLQFPNQSEPSAWQVFNPAQLGENIASQFAPHSGEQFLISFCPADQDEAGNDLLPPADHWLISPALTGEAQTVSFYAREITDQYGAETFEVWASSTDKEIASFTKVGDYSTDAVEWTQFTADLPAGTKYFAIRHISKDIFGLLIDDITFKALVGGSSNGDIVAFNIYVDGKLVATVEGDKTTYTVDPASIGAGEHEFSVTAVYADGTESKPASATTTATTAIEQIANDGKPVDVYSLDGKLVRQQTRSLEGLKGVYVINGKKVMMK